MINQFGYFSNSLLRTWDFEEMDRYFFNALFPLDWSKYGGSAPTSKALHQKIIGQLDGILDQNRPSDTVFNEIADIAIDIGSPYIWKKPYVGPNHIYADGSLGILKDTFLAQTLGADYGNDLRHLMILSYFYTQSMPWPTKDSGYTVPKIKMTSSFISGYLLRKKEWQGQEGTDTDGIQPNALTNKVYEFFRKTPYYFSPPFLGIKGSTHSSYLDIEALISLVSSRGSSNPYAYHDAFPKTFDIRKFLDLFAGITLDDDPRISMWDEFPYKDDPRQPEYDISCQELAVFNQFFLERMTNANFIFELYGYKNIALKNKFPFTLTDTLGKFRHLTLLRTRLNILRFHKDNLQYLKKFSNEDMLKWIEFLNEFLAYQLFCTVPILAYVFHYVMLFIYEPKTQPRTNGQRTPSYIDNHLTKTDSKWKRLSAAKKAYFEMECRNESNQYFQYAGPGIETKQVCFPEKISKRPFREFVENEYTQFRSEYFTYDYHHSFPAKLLAKWGEEYPRWLDMLLRNAHI